MDLSTFWEAACFAVTEKCFTILSLVLVTLDAGLDRRIDLLGINQS
jgi:hypothetical protein